MKYFKGKGYSKEFVSNFYEVIKRLNDNPTIRVTNYPDIICSPCPHNINDKCVKKGPDYEIEVKEKDDAIMKCLGLKLNQESKIKEIKELIDSNLTKLRMTCKDCEWLKNCI
jgi:hypothetical protein